MEGTQTPDTQTQVLTTPQSTNQTQSPWEALAKGWESLAQRAQSLTPPAQQSPVPATLSGTSSAPSGEVLVPEGYAAMDPTVQSWLDQGVTPDTINTILSVVPYTSLVPEIAGDFEAMAMIAADPDFGSFKDDPAYWARLRQNLQDEGISYNDALPAGSNQGQEPLTYPPLFSNWGNPSSVHPYYQQDSGALGRMLAEAGGDYDMGPRY